MRKLFAVALMLMVCLSLALPAVAQNNDLLRVKGHVKLVLRHCDKYDYTATTGHLWWKHTEKKTDAEACKADPSTVFYTEEGNNVRLYGGTSLLAYFIVNGAAPAGGGGIAYMALTSDVTVPAATTTTTGTNCGAYVTTWTNIDCQFPSEFTTLGLGRFNQVGSIASNVITYDHTWTCSACSSTAVNAVALFDRAKGTYAGTLSFWYKFATGATLNGSDQVEVTYTLTLS